MIVCYFSCGAASAIAAKLAINKYGKENVRVVNNPVANEHADNIRFLNDCEKMLGVKIEKAVNPCFKDCDIEKVFEEYSFMSNAKGFAPCTLELKQMARIEWERQNNFNKKTDIIIMGYTKGEEKRAARFRNSPKNKGYNLECPLIDNGYDKQRCFAEIEQLGIRLPEIYTKYEFPNANCLGCVKSGSAWYWNLVRKHFPEIFKRRAEQSRRLGCRLVDLGIKKNPPEGYERHIFLDELSPDVKGRKPKDCYVECGIFCMKGEN